MRVILSFSAFLAGPGAPFWQTDGAIEARLFVGVESAQLAMCEEDRGALQQVVIDGNGDLNGDGVATS
jgi:hypothetical protein